MKIVALRDAIKEYERSWYFRQLVYGDHVVVIQLRQFLEVLDEKPNEYELTLSDLFEVVKIISPPSSLSMIRALRNQIHVNGFFEVFNTGILNKDNFFIIYSFPAKVITILFNVLYRQSIAPPLKQTILEIVVLLYHEQNYSPETIKECFVLLAKNCLLKEGPLRLLKQLRGVEVFVLILRELDKAKQLNENNLTRLPQEESFRYVANLLVLVNAANISINHDLFQSICEHENLSKLLEISNKLSASTIKCLSKDTFSMLLKKEHLLVLEKIIDIFSTHSLVEKDEILIKKLLINPKCYPKLYAILAYLDRSHILHQGTIAMAIESRSSLFPLIDYLNSVEFYLNEEYWKAIFLLSTFNLQRLQELISNLVVANNLNFFTLEKALQRVTIQLPRANQAAVVKKRRKETGLPRSQVILDSQISFFKEHSETKQYEEGNFGKIKKGFDAPDGGKLLYGVKKFKSQSASQQARREVSFNLLLGREAFWFKREDKTTMVAEWQEGKSLFYFTPEELKEASFELRLRALLSGLKDLNILHANYRVHGDIKCQNFILNLQQGSMRLIDFGGSHKKGATNHLIWTSEYHESPFNADDYSFCDDMYSMGIVLILLCPELYTVRFAYRKETQIKLIKKSDLTTIEQALIALVNAMMEADRTKRCTSEAAIEYCQNLLDHFPQLDEPLLRQIMDSSINHVGMTIEDAFRGSLRASI